VSTGTLPTLWQECTGLGIVITATDFAPQGITLVRVNLIFGTVTLFAGTLTERTVSNIISSISEYIVQGMQVM
jgi:hypothetical protein